MSMLALLIGLMLPSPGAAPADFDLRIERDGAQWTVACAEGCRYSRASIACSGDCEIIISSHGVQTRRDDALAATDFAFVVSPAQDGWKATSIHGTVWRELAASCSGGCRTRVDENGVRLR